MGMKAKKKGLIIALICLTAFILMEYAFSPYTDAYRVNRHLDIGGVKLLMTQSQVEELLEEGSQIGGFGGDFYEYDNSAVTVAYHWDGLLKGKIGTIYISDPKYSICGVRPGNTAEEAKQILKKYGFVQDKNDNYCFKKGSVRIYTYGESVRIDIEDWTTRGRVY